MKLSLRNLKIIAREKVRKTEVTFDEFEDYLKRWWSKKYSLPTNHPLLLKLTLEELIIEHYTDVFENDPKELEEFESEIGQSRVMSDEDWFKLQMGEDYTTENAYSEEMERKIRQKKNASTVVEQESKKEDIEEDFNTLG